MGSPLTKLDGPNFKRRKVKNILSLFTSSTIHRSTYGISRFQNKPETQDGADHVINLWTSEKVMTSLSVFIYSHCSQHMSLHQEVKNMLVHGLLWFLFSNNSTFEILYQRSPAMFPYVYLERNKLIKCILFNTILHNSRQMGNWSTTQWPLDLVLLISAKTFGRVLEISWKDFNRHLPKVFYCIESRWLRWQWTHHQAELIA